MPLQGAAADLLDDAVAGQVLLRALDELREFLRVVVDRVPLLVLIRVDGRTVELVAIDDDSCVAVERQALCLLCPLVGRHVEARVACRQDGGHGEAADWHRLTVRALADGQAVGKQHEVRTLRQRNEVLSLQQDIHAARAPHATHARRVEDVAVLIGVNGRDGLILLAHDIPPLPFLLLRLLLRSLLQPVPSWPFSSSWG